MKQGKVVFEDEDEKKVQIKYPCFELKDIVEYFFEIQTPNDSTQTFSILSLPNVNIVVSIFLSDTGQTFKIHNKRNMSDTSGDKICGSLTEAITSIQTPRTHEFLIKFKPGVLYPFLSKDISILINNHLPLKKYLKQETIDELKSKGSFFERVEFAENWILDHLDVLKPDFKQDTVTKAIYYINASQDYKLDTVCKQACVSKSTLNRYFNEVLGVSPKQCFRAIRFKAALKNYRSTGSNDLYDRLGYTDFSHFVKEAKRLANNAPSEL